MVSQALEVRMDGVRAQWRMQLKMRADFQEIIPAMEKLTKLQLGLTVLKVKRNRSHKVGVLTTGSMRGK